MRTDATGILFARPDTVWGAVRLSGPAEWARSLVGPDGEVYVIWKDFDQGAIVGRSDDSVHLGRSSWWAASGNLCCPRSMALGVRLLVPHVVWR